MFIQHSISLFNLKYSLVLDDSWQKKQFINTYAVKDIQVFYLPGLTNEQTSYFISLA